MSQSVCRGSEVEQPHEAWPIVEHEPEDEPTVPPDLNVSQQSGDRLQHSDSVCDSNTMNTSHEGSSRPQPFDQEDFDRFRADPKRQALVERILCDDDVRTEAYVLLATLWRGLIPAGHLKLQLRGLENSPYPVALRAAATIREELELRESRKASPRTVEPCIDASGRRI